MAEVARERVVAQSFAAVRELALGLGELHTRLEGACDALLTLESREVPVPLQDEFRGLIGDIMTIEELDQLADELRQRLEVTAVGHRPAEANMPTREAS